MRGCARDARIAAFELRLVAPAQLALGGQRVAGNERGEPPAAVERHAHGLDQLLGAHRLGEEVVGAEAHAAADAIPIGERGEQDEGQRGGRGAGPHLVEQLETVHHRHLHVAHHHVRGRGADAREAFGAVGGGLDAVAGALEHARHQLAHALVVVDGEYARTAVSRRAHSPSLDRSSSMCCALG
jgi:hypothetical protein